MTDEVDQDENDLHGGFRWANRWQAAFFAFDCVLMLVSLVINLCLLRAMARNKTKETSIVYLFILFFFFTSLIDDALIAVFFMALTDSQTHTTTSCRFLVVVSTGNKLLQVFAVMALLYISLALMELKSKRIENFVRKALPALFLALVILEMVFALPPAMNIQGTPHGRHCEYIDNSLETVRLIGWLYHVLFPYYIPLLVSIYPFVKLALRVKSPDGASQRERSQVHIVLSIVGGYFFFHFLYYLLWLGREIEALLLEKSTFRQLLGLHMWYIARPLFFLINLGWHIVTPLSPFLLDPDLVMEFPGTFINRHRSLLRANVHEDIVLQDRPSRQHQEQDEADHHPKERVPTIVNKETQWTEIHNPLPMSSLDSDREYHQIPL